MAAVAGAGIDDLLVTLDGPEPPILDGDALVYLKLLEAGRRSRNSRRRASAIKVLQAGRGRDKDASATPEPADAPRLFLRARLFQHRRSAGRLSH